MEGNSTGADSESRRDQGSTGPERSFMDDPSIVWRLGHPPKYSRVNAEFLAGRSRHHAPGSLEQTVENLVKTWEMEASHKSDLTQWKTTDSEKYEVVVNGHHTYNAKDVLDLGTYSMLLVDSPYFDFKNHTFESSHALFRDAFDGCFPWEILEVFSGLPKVTATWRHWGKWTGPFGDIPPTGEIVEMVGMIIATVTDQLKIEKVEVFYDSNPFMQQFVKGSKVKCPFFHEG